LLSKLTAPTPLHLSGIILRNVPRSAVEDKDFENFTDSLAVSYSHENTSPSGFISPTHIRTEGRAPLWGSEFTTKAASLQGDSAEFSFQVEMQFM
jgi:hypothetical protein